MRIIATQYSSPNLSLDIYVAGCRGQCPGCHNPETWDFDQGDPWVAESVADKVRDFNGFIRRIMVMGGEPLDSPVDEVVSLLTDINKFGKEVWLFTRYELSEIDPRVLSLLHYVKCGRYDKELVTDDNLQFGFKLATANQYIRELKKWGRK
jgi:anaerobic ribonucleoside-triphosphate reductase activating protein